MSRRAYSLGRRIWRTFSELTARNIGVPGGSVWPPQSSSMRMKSCTPPSDPYSSTPQPPGFGKGTALPVIIAKGYLVVAVVLRPVNHRLRHRDRDADADRDEGHHHEQFGEAESTLAGGSATDQAAALRMGRSTLAMGARSGVNSARRQPATLSGYSTGGVEFVVARFESAAPPAHKPLMPSRHPCVELHDIGVVVGIGRSAREAGWIGDHVTDPGFAMRSDLKSKIPGVFLRLAPCDPNGEARCLAYFLRLTGTDLPWA